MVLFVLITFDPILDSFGKIQKSKMADQDGHHSEMITQLLRHVRSSPHDADIKGDIFRPTIYPCCHSFYILGVTKKGGGGGGKSVHLLNKKKKNYSVPVIAGYPEFQEAFGLPIILNSIKEHNLVQYFGAVTGYDLQLQSISLFGTIQFVHYFNNNIVP